MKDVTQSTVRRLLAVLILLLGALGTQAQTYNLTVAQDGSGNYRTVQAAIDAAPAGRTAVFTIYVKNGRYKEKITVPSSKPFLQLVGQSIGNVVLTYDDYSGKAMPGGGTFGTSNSASVTVNAADFSALNITFENTTGDAPQALAINVNATRAAFFNCRFLGGQDTVLANGSGNLQYFVNCYIDGVVDFIFGNARAVFERCVIYPRTRLDGQASSYITAANTQPGAAYGYVFRSCTIAPNRGTTAYVLGRPWQNSTGNSPLAQNKVVFLKTKMGAGIVRPVGWTTWDAGTDVSLITFGEFQSRNFRGGLVDVSQRVSWSRQLLPADTTQYQTATVLAGWNYCAVATPICASFTPPVVASNFRALKGASQSTFTWNASWAVAQGQYELLRASTRRGSYAVVGSVTAPNDTTYNFQLTDALPAVGSSYFYYLRSSKTGLLTHLSDTLEVSRIPTLLASGPVAAFTQYQGAPSAVRQYTLTGQNLGASVTVTPPAGFEVSGDGLTWVGSTSSLTLTPAGTDLTASVRVRLNAGTAGSYSGNIVHSSAGATPQLLPVSGSRVSTAPPVSAVLQAWPLRVSSQDSTAQRSAYVAASAPTLRRLFVSNGTAVPAYPAYSAKGQAFGASSNGDGSWGTTSGGPGGNLNRSYYEQFTVTATGRALRIDSLVCYAAFYNTASNTKLAVVYSRSNFVSDSTNIAGGTGPGGTLPTAANGGFSTPILLLNQNSGANQYYHLALDAANGLTLPAGQTLTIRLYFSCGSSSVGRYGLLRDVQVKGEALGLSATRPARTVALQAYPNPATDQLILNHAPAASGSQGLVYSFGGRLVGRFPVAVGTTATTVHLGTLAAGPYLLVLADGQARHSVVVTKP